MIITVAHLSIDKKRDLVSEICDNFKTREFFILTDFSGLSVAQITELRKILRERKAGTFKVYKNTLVRKAFPEPYGEQYEKLGKFLEGPTAIAFSDDDPISLAKTITEFAQKNEKIKIKCAFYAGKFIDKNSAENLAQLGSKGQLISILIAQVKAPLYKLINMLNAPTVKLMVTLKNVVEKNDSTSEIGGDT